MLVYTIRPSNNMNQTILLQLYRSVIEDMRFHKAQISRLENRAYQIEQAIIESMQTSLPYFDTLGTTRHNQQPNPSHVLRRSRPTMRRHPSTGSSETAPATSSTSTSSTSTSSTSTSASPSHSHAHSHSTQDNLFNFSEGLEGPSASETSPFGSAFTYMGTYDVPISALNRTTTTTTTTTTSNANTTGLDNPTLSPLATSLARGLLTRALTSASSDTASATADPGSLLFYFMMENMHLDDAEEPHGITDVLRYVTDMVYEEIESPPNSCCPIRMDVFSDEMEVSQINKCKHIFCRPELRTWLQSHHTCPLCRTAIDA